MTRSDFMDWRKHPITEEVFSAFKVRREQLIERMIDLSNYGDPRDLAETASAIKVYGEILNLEAPDGD